MAVASDWPGLVFSVLMAVSGFASVRLWWRGRRRPADAWRLRPLPLPEAAPRAVSPEYLMGCGAHPVRPRTRSEEEVVARFMAIRAANDAACGDAVEAAMRVVAAERARLGGLYEEPAHTPPPASS
ncbi:hypothetical protein [Streptomyces sp. NPDC008150]|uniref:hypothetical protein n=1 Tax=Streptomyces sp. NPDC008150 TaxID=3364816 RepID=UPI0036EEFB11